MQTDLLIERIQSLPPEKIAEVEDFVEFLWQKSAKRDSQTDEREFSAELRAIAASMMANTFTDNPPCFSREELHERR